MSTARATEVGAGTDHSTGTPDRVFERGLFDAGRAMRAFEQKQHGRANHAQLKDEGVPANLA
jgi:hypothetical protein